MKIISLRGKYGFLLIAVLSLLFLLVILSSMLVYTGSKARTFVLEVGINNEEEQSISESQVYWKNELESGTYTQQNPWPTKEYVVNPVLDTSFKMRASFGKNNSYNRPFPDTPAKNTQGIPSIGYHKADDATELGYNNTWVPPWHCLIALESTKKKKYLAMFSSAFPYGVYAPKGSIDLSSVRSFSNPMVDKAKEAGWVEDVNRAGMSVNMVAQDDITIDDYPHGYAYSSKGKVKIANKNGAIGLRVNEIKPDYSMRYEQDILNAFDKIAKVTMNKTHYLKGKPLDHGLFIELVYQTFSTIIDPKNSEFADIMSLEQSTGFPFLVVISIKERFGGMIWQVFFNYPDTCDRILLSPEDPGYAKQMEQYEKVEILMEGAAAIDYCWCNPNIDPTEEDDWQKRYLKLDVICPDGSTYGDAEFMNRQMTVKTDTLQKLIDKGHDSEYESRLDGKAFSRHNWTIDDLKQVRNFFKSDNTYKVYACDATLKYRLKYKDPEGEWVKIDYNYLLKDVEKGFTTEDANEYSADKINSKMKDEAISQGKSDHVKDNVIAQYEKDHGTLTDLKIDKFYDDKEDVAITEPYPIYGDTSAFKKDDLYDDEAYKKHVTEIWPGKVAPEDCWQHFNKDSLPKHKWFNEDHMTLFDREMYLKYGFLMDVQGYAEDTDFPEAPLESNYDEMSLRTERKNVPKHNGEPYDKFGIPGANYGKLFFHFFTGLFKSFEKFGEAIVDGDPMEFLSGFEQLFEEERRLVHFRGGKPDMVTDKSTVTIVSDWTVPRGRTLRLDCSLGVIGDIWIQDGATLFIAGDLMVCNEEKLKQSSGKTSSTNYLKKQMKSGKFNYKALLKSDSPTLKSSGSPGKEQDDVKSEVEFAKAQIEEMKKGKKEYFKPSGRVFLGKGANLLVGGDFVCMGTPEKGSIMIDTEIGNIPYVSASLICKNDVVIPYGILPGMSPSSLGAYLEQKGLKDWNKFLRQVELVPSQVAKVAGPFENRLCCFARYPDPITILNLTDFGLPIAIPFPTFYSTRTNTNISIFKGLGFLYSLTLNGVLGENLFTDCRWWSLLREDELYSETKKPKKEDVEEFLYSKEAEEANGGVPVFPKFGSRKGLEDLVNAFQKSAIKLPDMSEYADNVRTCLEITISEKLLEKMMAKVFEEILVKLFEDVFEETEFLKDLGEKGFEKIGEWFAEELFSGGRTEEYMENKQECNPAPAVIDLGIASNIYMKCKMSELTSIVTNEKPDYLIHETAGVLVYGKTIKIGTSDQKAGSCIFAPGLFVANKDIESYADRTVGCMISVNGNITARNYQYYPYFTRASLNMPAKVEKPLWQYMREYWADDESNYHSTESPIEIGKTIVHIIGEGWDK